jgi:drug/metabolite transporter (DMT)-like permease
MINLVRWLGEIYHPFEIVFFRNFFGLVVMLPWLARHRLGGLRTERFGLHALRGVIGLIAMTLWFTSIQLLPLAEATALSFTAPVFTTILAALILGEVMRVRRWTATICGLVGALIVLRPGAQAIDPAALLAIGTALIWGVGTIVVKLLARTEPPETIVTYLVLFLTPVSLVPALFVWQTPTLVHLAGFAALGALASVGHLCMTRAFAAADASYVAPFDYLRLPLVALTGYIIWSEVPDVWTWLGAAVIAGSALYIARRERQVQVVRAPEARAAARGAGFK